MDVYILDTSFNRIKVIDNILSFIWTERYNDVGDFEMTLPFERSLLSIIQRDYYLEFTETDRLMIIESCEITTDVENGSEMIVKGRSLESILDRRIIWNQTIITGNLQNGVKTLINDAIINPSIADRKIPNFKFIMSDDPLVTNCSIDSAQFTGDNLLTVVLTLTQQFGLGFKIILNDNNEFEFSLYAGTYRTYDQLVVPPVIFSPEFGNVISSSYFETAEGLKTVTLVAGEGEGADRVTAIVGSGGGIFRRELFTDARDISSKTDDGDLTPAEYNKLLVQRGIEKLVDNNNALIKLVDGELETTQTFIINHDYFLGDVVQFRDDYHNEANVRITEVIRSWDDTGYITYPTFDYIVDYDYLLAESEDILQTENTNEIEIDL